MADYAMFYAKRKIFIFGICLKTIYANDANTAIGKQKDVSKRQIKIQCRYF